MCIACLVLSLGIWRALHAIHLIKQYLYYLNYYMEKAFVFNEYQKTFKQPKIKTYDQVMRLVGLNESVRQWYADLKQEQATLVMMPDAFKEAGMTAEMWDDLAPSRDLLRGASTKYNSAVRTASAEFKTKMQQASKERNAVLEKVPMIIKLASLTQNNLPEMYQVELALIEDDNERSSTGKKYVKAYTTELVKRCLAGEEISPDPFM